jgi:nucleoside-diphosphate-sugar epimerase
MPGKTSRVAIAGGAAPGVGRTIADALVENGYEVVILTRRSTVDSTSASTSTNSPGFKKQQNHYTVRPIDYDDISDILSVLDADRIDTLISTIPSGLPISTHLNLLEAAKRSSTVKRYIPSNWGAGDAVNSKVDRFRSKHEALKMLRDADNANGLEFTCILPGQYFMNYLAQGSPKNLHGEAMSGLYDFTIPVDMNGRTAEVGGSGDEPLVFTRLEDLAQGVVQVLEEEKWECEATWVVGDVVCWNEVIRLAERILSESILTPFRPPHCRMYPEVATIERC